MLPRPRTLRQWRQEVEEKCAQLYDQLIVDDACLMELDLMHGARTCRELEDWPIASLVGGSRLMHTYGELIGYTGPIWLREAANSQCVWADGIRWPGVFQRAAARWQPQTCTWSLCRCTE
jgi:hypothetical protein